MKTIVSIVLVFGALISSPVMAQSWTCDYYLPQCPDKVSQYNKEYSSYLSEARSGKIPMLEFAKQAIALSERMYPKDKTLNDMAKQQYALIQFTKDSNASYEEKLNLVSLNADLLDTVIKDRFQMANAISEMQNQQQASRQPGNSAANTAAVATMLNGIGRAFNTSYGQSLLPPPQICNYYGGTRYCF